MMGPMTTSHGGRSSVWSTTSPTRITHTYATPHRRESDSDDGTRARRSRGVGAGYPYLDGRLHRAGRRLRHLPRVPGGTRALRTRPASPRTSREQRAVPESRGTRDDAAVRRDRGARSRDVPPQRCWLTDGR